MTGGESGARRGALLCFAVAAALSLPGLAFPFLSDDWALLDTVTGGPTLRTPFGDFRPLLMASLWLDLSVWGLSPGCFHLTNVGLTAIAAALVVLLVHRYTTDRILATSAGLLFALHPYHVETAAWIGSRADPLFAVFFLLSLLAYERWRWLQRGVPIAALALFEAALLSKESAVSLPLVLAGALLADPARRGRKQEWLRGVLPFLLVGLTHFILRFIVLGGAGRTLLGGSVAVKAKVALGFVTAAVLPLDPEILGSSPMVFGAAAGLVALVLITMAIRRPGRVPGLALAAGVQFAALLAPDVVGFQKRYFFLPAAASAVVLACLLRSIPARVVGIWLGISLVAGWSASGVVQWRQWHQAADASEHLITELARTSALPEVREILVANMPLRIAGGSVGGDMRAALALSGHRAVPVRAACWISYPAADSDALDGPPSQSIVPPPPFAEVRLRVTEAPFAHLAGPRPPPGGGEISIGGGTLAFDAESTLRVRLHPAPEAGRAAVAWTGGRLIRLFKPEG